MIGALPIKLSKAMHDFCINQVAKTRLNERACPSVHWLGDWSVTKSLIILPTMGDHGVYSAVLSFLFKINPNFFFHREAADKHSYMILNDLEELSSDRPFILTSICNYIKTIGTLVHTHLMISHK